ncbi:MAG: DUF177 domain-containing protein [Magnetospirillum sp.]|nr:DUF177 domain-containing protein [Magnetospirillum sp.]
MTVPPCPEFSRPVTVSDIPARGTEMDISAVESERAALARRFGIERVESLGARVRLRPAAGGLVRVNGTLVADVVQSCVVTLEPVPAHIEDGFAVTFGPQAAEEDEGELDLDFEAEDLPDPIVGGVIDIGDVVAEHLALALDPFPRAAGAVFQPPADIPDEPGKKGSPFAALERLRKK